MYLFQDLENAAKNIDFKSAKEAREWYRQEAMKIGKADPSRVMSTTIAQRIFSEIKGSSVGKMYMFVYDAKHKDTLPFFDAFPLVFPIELYPDGFLGINLHYLPPAARASLMDALYSTANNQKYNSSTKLNISYRILKTFATRFEGYQNCIKRYLSGQIRSSLHYVNPTDWDKALLLPLQQWKVNTNAKYAGTPPY
jgi:hypothetical protein